MIECLAFTAKHIEMFPWREIIQTVTLKEEAAEMEMEIEIQEWRLTMYRSDMAFKSFKMLVSLSEAVTQIRLKV